MTRLARQKESRSLRLYARLLELYPPAFLQRHRAEMLQNFADLEADAASKAALWLLTGKDLAMSLISHFFASRLGRYVIAVLVAWMSLFGIGYCRYGSTPGYPALHAFGGFLPGMLSMYITTRLYGTPRNGPYVLGVLVACISLFAIEYVRYGSALGHPILQIFEALCSACCPCTLRRASTEHRKTARTLRALAWPNKTGENDGSARGRD